MLDTDSNLTPDEISEEARWWLQFGFVDVNSRSDWSPIWLSDSEQARHHAEACSVGALYALDMLGHLKRHPQNPHRLVGVLRSMVAAGRWTAIEIGFTTALSDYLCHGRIRVSEACEVADPKRAA